jgi:hypothetical protein
MMDQMNRQGDKTYIYTDGHTDRNCMFMDSPNKVDTQRHSHKDEVSCILPVRYA